MAEEDAAADTEPRGLSFPIGFVVAIELLASAVVIPMCIIDEWWTHMTLGRWWALAYAGSRGGIAIGAALLKSWTLPAYLVVTVVNQGVLALLHDWHPQVLLMPALVIAILVWQRPLLTR